MPTTKAGTQVIYYDDSGAGHPVLLISGLGGNRLGWWKQIGPFSAHYRVINMDNRGAGDSPASLQPFSIADLADDAAGVIENLKLGPTHIVGISMGGMIAQELVLRHPQLVDKLVLSSTTPGGAAHEAAKPEITALLMRAAEEDLATRIRRTFTTIAGPGYMAAHPEDLDHIVENATSKPMSLASYQMQLMAIMGHSTSDRLGQIGVPTLVIHGDCDPLVPYSNGKYLAGHISKAQLSTYLGVGHLTIVEAAERFNREVLEFLC